MMWNGYPHGVVAETLGWNGTFVAGVFLPMRASVCIRNKETS